MIIYHNYSTHINFVYESFFLANGKFITVHEFNLKKSNQNSYCDLEYFLRIGVNFLSIVKFSRHITY